MTQSLKITIEASDAPASKKHDVSYEKNFVQTTEMEVEIIK